ncbi:hypothetical protein H8356DRAFT_1703412 [Neocallimastix lanati (nom. inval.)]|nr:hypothetical protein H8356DRAFT_1703412 [Neocallimastix sp. JGI-2020a]
MVHHKNQYQNRKYNIHHTYYLVLVNCFLLYQMNFDFDLQLLIYLHYYLFHYYLLHFLFYHFHYYFPICILYY